MTDMITWQADGGAGLEGVRLLFGASGGFRALGRLVRPAVDGHFTASYRLIVGDDGTLSRVSVTSATAQRERHLTINHTEDGFWLLDTGSGGTRAEFDGAVDVDLAYSPVFAALPIRRLNLHREPGEHSVPIVHVSLPELDVELVEQRYRTVRPLDADGTAVVEFRSGDTAAELVVDGNGMVLAYPGLATQLPTAAAPAPAPAPR